MHHIPTISLACKAGRIPRASFPTCTTKSNSTSAQKKKIGNTAYHFSRHCHTQTSSITRKRPKDQKHKPSDQKQLACSPELIFVRENFNHPSYSLKTSAPPKHAASSYGGHKIIRLPPDMRKTRRLFHLRAQAARDQTSRACLAPQKDGIFPASEIFTTPHKRHLHTRLNHASPKSTQQLHVAPSKRTSTHAFFSAMPLGMHRSSAPVFLGKF